MTEQNPKISVICPVYNVEKYIHRCLNSILNQTFTNFELILIDDGSKDNSGIICDEYAYKDSRITVIHKQNGGVASARQVGTDIARGNYIIHVDPDDWVSQDYLEKLFSKAHETDADVIICDYYIADDKTYHHCKQEPYALDAESILLSLFHKIHGSLWNKLIKQECYKKYDLHFVSEVNYCEDVLLLVQLLLHSEVKAAYLDEALYFYYQGNNNSITKIITDDIIKTKYNYILNLERILPVRHQNIAQKEKMNMFFYFWEIGYLSIDNIRNEGIKIKDWILSDDSIKKKIVKILAFYGHGGLAMKINKIKKYVYKR